MGTWTVIIKDRFGNDQDVTARDWYDAPRSRLKRAGLVRSAGNYITLIMPIGEYLTDAPDLTRFNKVVAGYRDSSFYWTDPWFGGYIISVQEEIPKDKAEVGEVVITIRLITFDDLQDRTSVRSWPASIDTGSGLTDALDPALRWHKPLEPTDPLVKGYPPGFTCRQWLEGRIDEGAPFDGILTRHLPFVQRGYVDPIYSGGDSIFDRFTRPTSGAVPGVIENTNVRGACQMVLGTFNTLLVSRAYYTARLAVVIRPVADGLEIVPEYSLLDLNRGV